MAVPSVVVLDSPALVAARAADAFAAAANTARRERGRFAVALSGGRTPRAMLSMLATRPIEWSHVHLFWSDERCVPPDDPNSNFGMAREALLDKIALPSANVHRMKGELEPSAAARDYADRLHAFFGGAPVFDLIFLGLGPDGHTASLFPNTPALDESVAACVANRVDSGVASPWRLTLTYRTINAARLVIFLVEGAEKARVLEAVLYGPRDVHRLPAQGVAPEGGAVTWLLDAAAAANLRRVAPLSELDAPTAEDGGVGAPGDADERRA